MAAGNEPELTHDELWDDSALVESWNEALEEYQVRDIESRDPRVETNECKQKYHSMAARGEKVPEVKVEYQQPKVPSKAEVMLGARPTPQAQQDIIEDEDFVEEDRGEGNDGLPNPATTLPGNFIGPIPPPKASNAAAANNPTPAGVVSTLNVPGNLAGMPQAMLGASRCRLSYMLDEMTYFDSSRRKPQEHDDVLVLCGLPYGAV